MNYWRKLSFERKAAVLFVLFFVLLAISPAMGIHNNYLGYNGGVISIFQNHSSPYPTDWKTAEPPFGNWFLWPPLFALFFYPFSTLALGPHIGSYVWCVLNMLVLMAGIHAVWREIDGERKLFSGWWYFFALVLMANEMIGSLTNLQINSLITGVILLGAAMYFRGRYVVSGFFLALGVGLKIIPLPMAMLLMLEFNAVFIASFVLFLAGLSLLPLLVMTPSQLAECFHTLIELHSMERVHTIYLGLHPTLQHYGIIIGNPAFFGFLLLNATIIAVTAFMVFRKDRGQFIRLLVPLSLVFMILFNKRAESPTYVMLVPIFTFMLHSALSARSEGDEAGFKSQMAFLLVGWFLISIVFSDLVPRPARQFANQWHLKTIGAVWLYIWSWKEAAGFFWAGRRRGADAGLVAFLREE